MNITGQKGRRTKAEKTETAAEPEGTCSDKAGPGEGRHQGLPADETGKTRVSHHQTSLEKKGERKLTLRSLLPYS